MTIALNTIANSIIKESVLFLKNDMNIEPKEIKYLKNITLKEHTGAIELFGKYKVLVVMSIDTPLFNTLFKKFFAITLDENEKRELEKEFPDEIINTIVGLSTRNFPSGYDELTLQPPLRTKTDNLKEMITKSDLKKFQISTTNGNIYFTISKISSDFTRN